MIQIAEQLAQTVPATRACAALGLPRSTLYRARRPRPTPPVLETPGGRRALNADEKAVVRATLNSERFQDDAPREVYATLLDEGTYLCSVPTMYRILRENQEIRERRAQLRHPAYAAPELLATAPNQVWTWDITKLLGPVQWVYFYLYVLLDLFSRFVVGWLIAERESTELAQVLIGESCARQNIQPHQLTLHADRGAPMIAKPLALLLTDLGVTESHSRPHVSNDNPFRSAVQNLEVSAHLSRTFRRPGRCPHLGPPVLSLVQLRASSFRAWSHDARGRALRAGRPALAEPTHGLAAGLPGSSRTFRKRSAETTGFTYRGVDQPAESRGTGGPNAWCRHGRSTLNS